MNQHHWTVPPSATGEALLDFLVGNLSVSRRRAKGLLDARVVFVNDRRVWMARHRLGAGDRVQVNLPREPGQPPAIPVLHRDPAILVVNKPAGWISNGADSVEAALRKRLNSPALAAIHRLDRDTTGCLIFSFDPGHTQRMVQGFRDQEVTKVYRAIVLGTPSPRTGAFTQSLEGKRARTEYHVLSAGPHAAQVRVRIETGRTHQIRKHFAAAGHPVAGDSVYATAPLREPVLKNLPRQMLHAESIRFPHPLSQDMMEVRAPLPADFKQAVKELGLG